MRHVRSVRYLSPSSNGGDYSFVAPKPSLSGQPGQRNALCIATEVKKRGRNFQLILTLETDDGETGRMWVQLPEPKAKGSSLTPTCRYMRLVRIALGTTPNENTPLHPANVFEGKRFRVFVGWRKSKTEDGGHAETGDKGRHTTYDDNLALEGPKGKGDFLRVHDLLELLDGLRS